ncbi:hypothetical protein AMTRI_Chr09g16890 [Amborella trichopoda]
MGADAYPVLEGQGGAEPSLRYHSGRARILTLGLPKGNGGVQWFPRDKRRLTIECKGRRELDLQDPPVE